jgi:uracil-DNA glycosylase
LKPLGEKKRAGCEICPESSDMLNVFKYTGWDDISVIILGQDPYHTPGIADGLAFSSKKITFRPPSLRNIYKEIETDLYNGLNFNIPDHQNNNLKYLAFQGVFLLNTALTTEIGKPGEHAELWEPFTKMLISYISEYKKDVIFVLWGNHAKKYKKFIDENKHHIIEGVHPSPLSAERGFFGCKHFSQINKHLKTLNKKEIVWENIEYSSMVH